MPKKTTIEEAKTLSTLSIENLIGSLISHEIALKAQGDEDSTKRNKTLAFKASENSHK
ncbi:unnamed protein product [Linum tenue]|uniref:UBN2 domain-containing protein n=1 Tax=Linum tenue TaxID=586396 RepID=A0AAV0LKU8_9ROSI|nr:unnamed protein product [Linum tenue]